MLAPAARADNATTTAAVTAALQAAGLASADIKSSQLTVAPHWTYGRDGDAKAAGIDATNRLHIETHQLDAVGLYLDAALNAGAKEVSAVSFSAEHSANNRTSASASAHILGRPGPGEPSGFLVAPGRAEGGAEGEAEGAGLSEEPGALGLARTAHAPAALAGLGLTPLPGWYHWRRSSPRRPVSLAPLQISLFLRRRRLDAVQGDDADAIRARRRLLQALLREARRGHHHHLE